MNVGLRCDNDPDTVLDAKTAGHLKKTLKTAFHIDTPSFFVLKEPNMKAKRTATTWFWWQLS